MRFALVLAAACGWLTAAEDPREIVRRAVAHMDQNLQVARNYTFLERSATNELDGAGKVKTRKVLLYDVTMLEGSPYRRLVGRDDHALSSEETGNEEKKLEASIGERRKETPKQRAQRIADWEKRRQRLRDPLNEVLDAFDLKMAGEEPLAGRRAWIIDAVPRAGYHPRSGIARLFPKLRGKLWIDEGDYQWVKTEAEATDTISLGWILARLKKGARLDVEMTRVNDEVWLPKRVEARLSARIALFKTVGVEQQTTYSNYRKFQVDSHLVSVAPAP